MGTHITMRVTEMMPLSNGVKLSGFRVADGDILEKYPLSFDFIPTKHGMENFPRIGQNVELYENNTKINKIVHYTPRLPSGFHAMSKEQQNDFLQNSLPNMVKRLNSNDNILQSPIEIVHALGISNQQLEKLRESNKPLSDADIENLLSVKSR